MPAHPLGEFYEGFSSFRRMLAKAPAENWPVVFANCVSEAVSYVGRGLDKVTAVDELVDMAASIGFADAEAVQRMLHEQFAKIALLGDEVRGRGNGPTDAVDWDELAEAEPDIDLNRDYDAVGRRKRSPQDEPAKVVELSARRFREPVKPAVRTAVPSISSTAFMATMQPPEYLVENVLHRRFIYSLTGKTGAGKTSIALYLVACVALGRPIGALEVTQGRVLYLAGENPDDVQYRWCALSQQLDFDYDAVPVEFIPKRLKLSEQWPAASDQVALVVVDSAAAYYEGDEVNSNTQLGDYARQLRELTVLPGGPTVLVLCHPIKNAADDNLIPLGAGSFLNEVDGNLTATAKGEGTAVEVHWQGKIRGQDFAPLNFELARVGHERLVTAAGKPMKTVVARYLSQAAREGMEKAAVGNAHLLLAEIKADPEASQRDYARALGWTFSSGEPDHPKIGRLLKRLQREGFIARELGVWKLREKAKKHALHDAPDNELGA